MISIATLTSNTELVVIDIPQPKLQQQRELQALDIIVFVIYGLIALTSILGNGITILIIVRNVTFHTLYNFLLLNLAAADFISGLFSIIQLIVIGFASQSELSDVFSDIFCKLFAGIIYLNIIVSINTLTAIALERFYGIMKPIVHRNMTSKRLKFIVLFIWLWSSTTAAPVARELRMEENAYYCGLSDKDSDWPLWKLVLGWFGLISIYICPLGIITFLYSKIVRHFRATNRTNSNLSVRTNGSTIAATRSAKTVKLLVLITVLFATAILPELVYFGLVLYDRRFVDTPLFYKIGIPTVASIAINPFIYTLTNPTFRQEAKRIILGRKRTTRVNVVATDRVNTRTGGEVSPQLSLQISALKQSCLRESGC